ncbi:MAG: hypothetical protein SF187_20275 [Deltaproteobacteria bacterium]|nr:hypothetical protein [Deltaproteobacteria bacterium]
MRRPGRAALRGEILGERRGEYVLATEDGSVEYVPKNEVGDVEAPGKAMFWVGAASLLTLNQVEEKYVGGLLFQDLQLTALGLVVYFRSVFQRQHDLSKISYLELERIAAPPEQRSGWLAGYVALAEATGSYWGYEYKPSRWAYRASLGALSLFSDDKTSYGLMAGMGAAYGGRNRLIAEGIVDNVHQRSVRLAQWAAEMSTKTLYTVSVNFGYERYVSRNVYLRGAIGPAYRFDGARYFDADETKWHLAIGVAAGMKL